MLFKFKFNPRRHQEAISILLAECDLLRKSFYLSNTPAYLNFHTCHFSAKMTQTSKHDNFPVLAIIISTSHLISIS